MALASQVLRSDGPLAKFPQNDGFWLGAVVAACLSGAFNVWAWRRYWHSLVEGRIRPSGVVRGGQLWGCPIPRPRWQRQLGDVWKYARIGIGACQAHAVSQAGRQNNVARHRALQPPGSKQCHGDGGCTLPGSTPSAHARGALHGQIAQPHMASCHFLPPPVPEPLLLSVRLKPKWRLCQREKALSCENPSKSATSTRRPLLPSR
jgi:hypothetical protein